MYDATAILHGAGTESFDEYGNPIIEQPDKTVYVQPRGVYSSEFYQAAQTGLHPSVTLYMTNRADYDGEKWLTFQGQDYDVIRVDWNAQRDGIRLICEERINNGE